MEPNGSRSTPFPYHEEMVIEFMTMKGLTSLSLSVRIAFSSKKNRALIGTVEGREILKIGRTHISVAAGNIQVLKVHINCDGCRQKVKKLLKRIEGVYTVDVDSEQHKVTVTGIVESDTLIKKLGRSGKHAEIWSPPINTHQNQNHEAHANWIKNGKAQNQMQRRQMKAMKRPKSRLPPTCGPEAEEDWGYYGYLNHHNMGMDGEAVTDGMENVHVGGNGHGYGIDGDDNMKSMMGFQGMRDNGVGGGGFQHMYGDLPSSEYHQHPPYMMMGNMQGHPYNQPSPTMMINMGTRNMDTMNMGMRHMHTGNNHPMMNRYMHMHQP
ncbi:hypothetical protein ACSBR1_023549 [Camellia fascicularis]